jgi:hypothetical protein
LFGCADANKITALWVVAAFAAGIGAASRWHASQFWFIAATLAIIAGTILIWLKRAMPAWIFALLAWLALGALATAVERAAVPANHVSHLVATSEPLRWRRRLREDPPNLPWGPGYEIELQNVECGGIAGTCFGPKIF